MPYCMQEIILDRVGMQREKTLPVSGFPSRKESVVYGEILELEAKMQTIFQVKTYSWESTQYEDVRGFGFSIRLFFNSLA